MTLRNPYREFFALLPARPLLVGDVVAVDGGLALVELPGGGRLRVRGQAAVGQRVFVRDNVIEGEAPALTYVESEL